MWRQPPFRLNLRRANGFINSGSTQNHVTYSLNSLKGGYIGVYIGTTIGVIKGDTRSLDNGSC